MTWINRLRMAAGIVLVVALVAVLTVVFSQRKGETTSRVGTIVAEQYGVGTDYPGTVVEQMVVKGDAVQVGDEIATIQSNALLQALDNDQKIPSTDVYTVGKQGMLTIKSTVDGVVSDVAVQQGGYASAGNAIATIDATSTLFVEAEFQLDPTDYARVEQGAPVRIGLPDSSEVMGEVRLVSVETDAAGRAETTVEVSSDELLAVGSDGIVAPGTPVQATLKLRNDDPLARVVEEALAGASDFVRLLRGWTA